MRRFRVGARRSGESPRSDGGLEHQSNGEATVRPVHRSRGTIVALALLVLGLTVGFGVAPANAADIQVRVCVNDSGGNPLDPGTTSYQIGSGSIVDFGNSLDAGCKVRSFASGTGDVTIRTTYNGTTSTLTQNISSDPTFTFQTHKLTLRLETCSGAPLDGGHPRFGNGAVYTTRWFPDNNSGRATGDSAPGELAGEIFAGTYSFEMQYQGTADQKLSVDVPDSNSTLTWQTTNVTVDYPGSVSYGGSTGDSRWFKQTSAPASAELLPGTYRFHFRDVGATPGFTEDLTFGGCAYSYPPAPVWTVAFDTQPSETLKLSTIDPSPAVTVTDSHGDPVVGEDVTVSLETINHGPGTLSGTETRQTDSTGVATFPDLSVAEPGTYDLVATAGGFTATSDEFAVDNLLFETQPTWTQKNSPIDPAPTVTIRDPDGNGINGLTVNVTLQTISGTGHFAGSTLSATTATVGGHDGVATFSNLKIDAAGQYRLEAESDHATALSNAFLIANEITNCGSSCSAQGSTSDTTVQALSNNADGAALAVSVIGDATVPGSVCGDFTPLGAGSYLNILRTGAATPDVTVTWRLDKSIVLQAGNPGAAHFDICLGAEDLAHPDGSGATPWTTKSGAPATEVDDTNLGVHLFWGILPDCPKKGALEGPCVLHRNKNKGDEVIDFLLPYPWDAHWQGG